jgi:hypothetical protein
MDLLGSLFININVVLPNKPQLDVINRQPGDRQLVPRQAAVLTGVRYSSSLPALHHVNSNSAQKALKGRPRSCWPK